MALSREYPERFERIWKVYPKWPSGRSKKELAYRAFAAADRMLKFTESDIDSIVNNITERTQWCETWQRGNKFGPVGLQVYINQHLWNEAYMRVKHAPFTSSEPELSVWQRMGYASEQDYYAGRRMH